jgi:hypothetical protein
MIGSAVQLQNVEPAAIALRQRSKSPVEESSWTGRNIAELHACGRERTNQGMKNGREEQA